MEDSQIDILAVLVAAVLSKLIWMAWHSPWLFGNAWLELTQSRPPIYQSEAIDIRIRSCFCGSLCIGDIRSRVRGDYRVRRDIRWLSRLGGVFDDDANCSGASRPYAVEAVFY